MHVLYFVLGLLAVAIALGWRPSLDAARAIIAAVWAGVWALVVTPWGTDKGVIVFALAWGHRLLLAVGVVLVLLSITIGGAIATGGDARANLDAAIRAFQASVGLTVDGLFGPDTVRAFYGHR